MPKLGLVLSAAGAGPLRMPAGNLAPAGVPSGIPVAGTNSVIVTYSGYNRTLTKPSIFGANSYGVNYGAEGEYDDVLYFNSTNNRWEFPGPYSISDTQRVNSSTNPNYIPTTGWSPAITITAVPSGIPTATANSITLQSGDDYFGLNGAQFDRQNNGYFGDVGDYKLVWNGTRWEILGDNNSLSYYSLASGQSADWFPREQSWFRLSDSQNTTLTFTD